MFFNFYNWTKVSFCVLALVFFHQVNAQKPQPFQGLIKYGVALKGKTGRQMQTAFPTDMYLWVKQKKIKCQYKSQFKDSAYFAELLIDGNSNTAYQIFHYKKLILKGTDKDQDSIKTPNLNFTPTNEYDTILEYRCRKYKATTNLPMAGGKIEIEVWINNSFQIEQEAVIANQQFSILSVYGTSGFPLRKVFRFLETNLTIDVRAYDIQRAELKDGLFSLPKYYEVKPFAPSQKIPTLIK